MELDGLIQQLKMILMEADGALDGGDEAEAREHLRTAKNLLDDEFLSE